jgi:hypothetical protein
MVLPHVALRLLASSVVITGVALAGSAMAKPLEVASASDVAKVASTAPAAALAAAAPVAASAPVAACARKVKVIYAGYGEADRASCLVSSKIGND